MSEKKPQVEKWNEASDGPLSEAALREKMESLGYSVSRYDYPPGTYFPVHTHDLDKIDAVVAGRFQIDVRGERIVLEAGDLLRVPRGTPHSARVVGGDTVVSLDGVRR